MPSPALPPASRVVIVQRRLTHYRVPLFESLRERLAREGVTLVVWHGEGTPEERAKKDEGTLDWAERLPTRYALGGRLCWQPFGDRLREGDLVVVTQENRLLFNHLLLLRRKRRFRLAFWGHGANLQARSDRTWRERFKRWTGNRVDWWFGYTAISVDLVRAIGFPVERITNLKNAVDTRALAADCARVSTDEVAALRASLVPTNGLVALYLGSLYADKRIDFLLRAGADLARRLPGFRLVIVGDGPQRLLVEEAAARQPWLHYAGAKRGHKKAVYLRAADVMLNPGMVGLTILDAFVAGVPMLTTDCGTHSPEVAYLEHGRNGLVTCNTLPAFVDETARLLVAPQRLSAMRSAAASDASRYTIAQMADRFCAGLMKARAAERRS